MHETAKLTASNGAPCDYFGHSVTLDGDTAAAGAISHDAGVNQNQGAVYVFTRPVDGWVNAVETAMLTAAGGAAGDAFGSAVALDGDTLAVGAVGVGEYDGAAYIFLKPPGGWTAVSQVATLTSSNPGISGDELGFSASLQGETLVVGAPYRAFSYVYHPGAAYVFVRPQAGWSDATQTAVLTSTGTSSLGWSVAVDGSTVIAGTPWVTGAGGDSQGAALVFTRPASGWTDTDQAFWLTAWDGAAMDGFGGAVEINGSEAFIGAQGDDTGMVASAGSAYVFVSGSYLHLYLPLIRK